MPISAVHAADRQLKSLLQVDLLRYTEGEGRYSLLPAPAKGSRSRFAALGGQRVAVAPPAGPVCSSPDPAHDGN